VAKRAVNDVRKWAVLGAEQRLLQISEEAAAIYRSFPELRRGGGRTAGAQASTRGPGRGRRGRQASQDGDGGAAAAGGGATRRRRRLSAAARKRISDAQKRRWAKHRKQKEQ
jgi:hypothetical protein